MTDAPQFAPRGTPARGLRLLAATALAGALVAAPGAATLSAAAPTDGATPGAAATPAPTPSASGSATPVDPGQRPTVIPSADPVPSADPGPSADPIPSAEPTTTSRTTPAAAPSAAVTIHRPGTPAPGPAADSVLPGLVVTDAQGVAQLAEITFTACAKPTGEPESCATASEVLSAAERSVRGASDLLASSVHIAEGRYNFVTIEAATVSGTPASLTATWTRGAGWRDDDAEPGDGVLTFVVAGAGPSTPPPADPTTPAPTTTQTSSAPVVPPVQPTTRPSPRPTAAPTRPRAPEPVRPAGVPSTVPGTGYTLPAAPASSEVPVAAPAPAAPAAPAPAAPAPPAPARPAPGGVLETALASPMAAVVGGGVLIAGVLLIVAPPTLPGSKGR